MKSLVWLSEQVLRDCGIRCSVDPTMDIRTVHRRVENEGVSFLTITLPTLGKAFDRALAVGCFPANSTPSFRRRKGLPVFLQGFLGKIFNADGTLRIDPCPDCIECVRQICRMHSKVLLECTEKRSRAAEDAYLACENELGKFKMDADLAETFGKVSAIVLTDLLREIPFGDPYPYLNPRHGPGATQDRVKGNGKYLFRKWHSRLEEQFPFTEFGIGSIRNLGEKNCPLARVKFIEPGDEAPVRVVFVPKTLKTPRVIAIEPVCMQYMQQALLQFLVPLIEQGTYTAGRVNFTHQSINRELARQSSIDGSLATIDLSEASDRVSLELVELLLKSSPILRDMIMACRSTSATLPSGLTVQLAKFASMGSALCFPIEALAFFCAIITIRCKEANVSITSSNVRKYSKDVYVYGDDIIVPAGETLGICNHLKLFGLKVNTDKTFWTGKFRESCGMDAFDGIDVTPVYCRRLRPTDSKSAAEIVSWVEMANLFYKKGFWHTARSIRNEVELVLRHKLPHRDTASEGLGWHSYSKLSSFQRWNRSLFRFETRTLVATTPRSRDILKDDGALLKCLKIVGLDSISPKHLLETIRRGTLALKYRWVSA